MINKKIITSVLSIAIAIGFFAVSGDAIAAPCGTITTYNVNPNRVDPNSSRAVLHVVLDYRVTENCIGVITGDVEAVVAVTLPNSQPKIFPLASPLPAAPTGAVMEFRKIFSVAELLQGHNTTITAGQPTIIRGMAFQVNGGVRGGLLADTAGSVVDFTADYIPPGGSNQSQQSNPTGNNQSGQAGPCEPSTQELVDGKCVVKNPAPNNLLDFRNFQDLLKRILQILLAFAAAIALIFLVIGGFQYVTARGNEEATEKAKKTIAGSIIGLVIIIMSFAIVTIVNNILTQNQPNGSGAANLQQQAGQNGFNVNLLAGNTYFCQASQACVQPVARITGGTAPYIVVGGQPQVNGMRPSIIPGEYILEISGTAQNLGRSSFMLTIRDSSVSAQNRNLNFNLEVSP